MIGVIASGKKEDPQPKKLPKDSALCVDMWGQWILYKAEYYISFPRIVEEFVNSRKFQSPHFNPNHIRKIILTRK